MFGFAAAAAAAEEEKERGEVGARRSGVGTRERGREGGLKRSLISLDRV